MAESEKRRRVLLVDDNRSIHQDYRKILCCRGDNLSHLQDAEEFLFDAPRADPDERPQFELTSVYQGEEAVRTVARSVDPDDPLQPFEAAFVDVRMPPGIDGVVTVERIWDIDPRIQIVLCTTFCDYTLDEITTRLGETDKLLILKKPFDQEEVRLLGVTLCEKWRVSRQAELQFHQLEELVEARTSELELSRRDAIRMMNEAQQSKREIEVAHVQLRKEVGERERAESAVRERDRQLQERRRLEAIGVLASGVAHEFNNLLQIVQGYTRFAVKRTADMNDVQKDLGRVLKASEQAGRLTRQLLSFSRQADTKLEVVDLNTVVAEIMETLQPLLGEFIVVDTDLKGEAFVVADQDMLAQVLLNLSLNARDAMDGSGRLAISTRLATFREDSVMNSRINLPPGDYFMIEVTDNGCGMPPHVMSRIFEPFFTTRVVGQGSGLGLSFAYGVIEQHGGTIRVESTPGTGTTFAIYLPKHDEEETPTTISNETILVVDDDDQVRQYLADILEDAGYRTQQAKSGHEALLLLEDNDQWIDLAVLDIMMPGIKGTDVYHRARDIRGDLPVVFCTGLDPHSKEIEFAVQEHAVVEKPANPKVLVGEVRKRLKQRTKASRSLISRDSVAAV